MPGVPTAEARVVHVSPTRTRLRLLRRDRGKAGLARIKELAARQAGVTKVEVNETSGSVLIHHERGTRIADGLGAVLADVGIVLSGLESGDVGPPGGHSEAAVAVEAALNDLNQRVAVATGGKVDLKLLLPAGFIGAGVWRTLADPAALFADIPTFFLFWLGIDLYTKFRRGGMSQER